MAAWYDNLDPDHLEELKEKATVRLVVSVLVLAFRDYKILHMQDYLEDGRPTKKCYNLGKRSGNTNGDYTQKAGTIDSVSEVLALIEFLEGPGLGVYLDMLKCSSSGEEGIRRGIQQIADGKPIMVPSHEPERLDAFTRIWSGSHA